jgi:hypothetical protein
MKKINSLVISAILMVIVGLSYAQYTGKLKGVGSDITNLTPANIDAGTLGSAVFVSTLPVNIVGTTQLENQAVTAGKIANNTITNSQIANNTIGDSQMANATYSNVKISAGNVNAGSLGASVIASSIAVGAIDSSAQIVNGVVSNDDLAGSITDAKLNTIATAGKVDGSALTNLSNIPLIAGFVPNANIDPSSITKQGNTFNGPNQLVQLNGSSQLPAVDGSQLTGISVTKIGHFGGFNMTLGVGTTFFATTPDQNITLKRITVNIVSAGEGGSTGTTWRCGDGTNNLSVTTSAGATAGSNSTTAGTQAITSGTKVSGWIVSSDETVTPSANVICEYQ